MLFRSCTLKASITRSLNTVFYGLAYDVGPEKVATVARAAAGIPETWDVNDSTVDADLQGHESLSIPGTDTTGGSIGIGEYAVRPIQQAVGFATFAAGGVYHPAHFVASIVDGTGAVLLPVTGTEHAQQVVPADVASDVTFAMEDVASYSKRSLDGARPVASKTGTQGKQGSTVDDTDAWMVGYTPSISTAVWMGTQGAGAITNAQGKPIYGSGLPGAIWQEFMNTVLAGTPKEPLPTKALIKGDPTTSNVAVPTTQAPVTTTQRAPASTTYRAPASSAAAETTTSAPATTSTSTSTSASASASAGNSGAATTTTIQQGRQPTVSVPAGQPNG